MQPKYKMKKTLLASALLLGLGNAFHASSTDFTATASTIPDVAVTAVTGKGASGTKITYGNRIKLNPSNGDTCTVVGASNALESDIGFNITDDTAVTQAANVTAAIQDAGGTDYKIGQVFGAACIPDDASGTAKSGETMLLDINGGAGNVVSITIPEVSGTGWKWNPGSETCFTKFDGANGGDTCESFLNTNTKTGVRMAAAGATEFGGTWTVAGEDDPAGKVRLLLGGTLEFDGADITSPVAETITVTVVYE